MNPPTTVSPGLSGVTPPLTLGGAARGTPDHGMCESTGCTSQSDGNHRQLCLAHWEQYQDFFTDAQTEPDEDDSC